MSDSDIGSVTHWITNLKQGDAEALRLLWDRYRDRLLGLAESRLRNIVRKPGAIADENDAVNDALDSLFRGATSGKYSDLDDRDSLWRILATITARKALDQIRYQRAKKRGWGKLQPMSTEPETGTSDPLFGTFLDDANRSAFASTVEGQCGELLDLLQNPRLEQIAVWKMQGYTTDEIAEKLDRSSRTVGSHLKLIRRIWEEKLDELSRPTPEN